MGVSSVDSEKREAAPMVEAESCGQGVGDKLRLVCRSQIGWTANQSTLVLKLYDGESLEVLSRKIT